MIQHQKAGFEPVRLVKGQDQVVNSETTLQDDADLQLAVGTGEVWAFLLAFTFNSPIDPGLKWQIQVPNDASAMFADNASAVTRIHSNILTATGSNDNRTRQALGTITTGANGGLAKFTWAQSVSDSADTRVLAGSFLLAWKLL